MQPVVLLSFLLAASSASGSQDAKAPPASRISQSVARGADHESTHWIGTWAAAAQPAGPRVQTYRNQTLRLIAHTSVGGAKIRIRISNDYGERPLLIGAVHVARRAAGADIDPASDRAVLFQGRSSTTVSPKSMVMSDAVGLDAPALSDLAISIFLPQATEATTTHSLAALPNTPSSTARTSGPHLGRLEQKIVRQRAASVHFSISPARSWLQP